MSGSTAAVRVLIVDDQEVFRRAATAVVDATDGFDVVATAPSGEQAVELAAEHRPHVVLMDVRMPGIGGVEATRRIGELDPAVLVLLLSANDASLIASGDGPPLPVVDKADLTPELLRDRWDHAHGGARLVTTGGPTRPR